MKKIGIQSKEGLFTILIIITSIAPAFSQSQTWLQKFSDDIIAHHADINDLTNKGWEYSNGIVLIGIEKLYYETGDEKYLNYIKNHIDNYVSSNGSISDFEASSNNLDKLHPGWMCLTLYEETGEQKYKLAADKVRAEFDNQPRNPSGGFWHKERYPYQMWADGVYMAQPFLVRYGAAFDDLEYAANEATKQAILIADHAYDADKHLIYHGWDETKNASWADPVTGVSPEVWSRGMGWYCMALVDILDYLPTDHENYSRMIEILQNLSVGIKDYQDESTGLWYQVVDKGNLSSNWLETSGSAMFVYTLKKAIDKGYIDSLTYAPVATKGWEGLQTKITMNQGRPVINEFVRGMGIKDNYSAYVNEQRVSTPNSNYPHGYCGILLASWAMEYDPFDQSVLVEKRKATEIMVQPSFADDMIYVDAGPSAIEGWQIYNLSGRLAMESQDEYAKSTTSGHIGVSGLNKGMYFFKTLVDGHAHVARFVKM